MKKALVGTDTFTDSSDSQESGTKSTKSTQMENEEWY